MQEKPRVGISSCLLGHRVRYDGGHKREPLLRMVGKFVEWIPVCPEFEVGMGVPREPVRLEESAKGLRMIGESSRRDWTRRMNYYARGRVRELKDKGICGFVLKQNSPSCGVEGIPLMGPGGRSRKVGRGLFAQTLKSEMPLLPTAEEGHLRRPRLRDKFLERVFACRRWQEFLAGPITIRSLAAFHEGHRLVVMAHSEAHLGRLDSLAGGATARSLPRVTTDYGKALMEALCSTPTRSKRKRVLRHILRQLQGRKSAKERSKLGRDLERYLEGRLSLRTVLDLLRRHADNHRVATLRNQLYFLVYQESLRRESSRRVGTRL